MNEEDKLYHLSFWLKLDARYKTLEEAKEANENPVDTIQKVYAGKIDGTVKICDNNIL